jgi:putative hydrolase of the HAD superfamily
VRPIETLFIDAGGVLLHPNWDTVAAVLRSNGVKLSPTDLEAADLRARRALDLPTNARAASDDARVAFYFDTLLEQAGLIPSPASTAAFAALRRYHVHHNLWERVPSELRPALDRIRRLGLRVVVVSNANGTLHAHMERLGLTTLFDLILDSHAEGVEKPDPRIFERALERSGASAATTLHVGDLYHVDVVGARAAGIEAWLLDPAGLYADADCERVASLTDLADRLEGVSGR